MILHEAQAFADLAVNEDDRTGCRERAARGNADQRRIGERIAKQSLHDGAGYREQAADHAAAAMRESGSTTARVGPAGGQRIRGSVGPQAERRGQPGEWNAGSADERDSGAAPASANTRQRMVSTPGRRERRTRATARFALSSASAVIAGTLL